MRSAGAIIEKFGRNDIIYSVGLADYIPDKLLIPMLSAWQGAVNPGGVVYVAFKDARRYDKVEYQWLMDWHFLQRTEDDCRRLLELAGYDMDHIETSRDETGVILHYVSRSKVPAFVRFDQQSQPAVRQPLGRPIAVRKPRAWARSAKRSTSVFSRRDQHQLSWHHFPSLTCQFSTQARKARFPRLRFFDGVGRAGRNVV